MRIWYWSLVALVCLPLAAFAAGDDNSSGLAGPASLRGTSGESRKADRLFTDYADEIWHAREWLTLNNDVTRVVELLNAMAAPEDGQVEESFRSAMKSTFPRSRRVPELEADVARRLDRFFEYYHLRGKIQLRVFSLGFPMAFNSGQVVGVSDTLVVNWGDEELAGVVSHEIGHIIAQAQDRISELAPPDSKAYERAEEIKADWIAMMMFQGAGLDPEVVANGLERIVPRAEWKRSGPQHPPMAVRSAMMREWLTLPRRHMRLHDALLQSSKPAAILVSQKKMSGEHE